MVLNSDDDDELPDWAANFKSPYTGGFRPQASSSEDEKPISKSAGTGRDKEDEAAPKQGDSGREAGPDQGGIKPGPTDHIGDTEHGTKGSPWQRPGKTRGMPTIASPAGLSGPCPSKAPKQDAPTEKQQEHSKTRVGPVQAGAAGPSQPSPSKAPQQDESTGKQDQKDNTGGGAPSSRGDKNKMTNLVIPDKLPRNKVMAELCPGEDDQLVDLAGDSGAVGRMIVAGEQGSEQLQVDLKGAMFDASVLPLAGTALVVNIGPSEAKVEALVNDYLHLHPMEGLLDDEDGGYGKDLMVSEDENYQPEQEGAPAEEGKSSKKKTAKAGAKAGATKKPRGGSSASGSKQSGGIRKKTGPPKKAGTTKPKPKKQ